MMRGDRLPSLAEAYEIGRAEGAAEVTARVLELSEGWGGFIGEMYASELRGVL